MSEELRRKPVGLGRGLSALMGDVAPSATSERGVREIPIAHIEPNEAQPRKHFAHDALQDLAQSIKSHGVLQPIVLRQRGPDNYQIIAGERRYRAAKQAGLHAIPAIVRDFDDRQTLSVAIVENIQREQLNAIEEGQAYKRLVEEFGHSQDDVATAVHKSRSHVANLIRLLDLPTPVSSMLADGRLTMGHARALLGVDDAASLATKIVDEQLSVRQVEALAQQRRRKPGRASRAAPPAANDDLALLERQLGDLLGLKVGIVHEGKGGRVTLSYASLEQLDLICQRLTGERI